MGALACAGVQGESRGNEKRQKRIQASRRMMISLSY